MSEKQDSTNSESIGTIYRILKSYGTTSSLKITLIMQLIIFQITDRKIHQYPCSFFYHSYNQNLMEGENEIL